MNPGEQLFQSFAKNSKGSNHWKLVPERLHEQGLLLLSEKIVAVLSHDKTFGKVADVMDDP